MYSCCYRLSFSAFSVQRLLPFFASVFRSKCQNTNERIDTPRGTIHNARMKTGPGVDAPETDNPTPYRHEWTNSGVRRHRRSALRCPPRHNPRNSVPQNRKNHPPLSFRQPSRCSAPSRPRTARGSRRATRRRPMSRATVWTNRSAELRLAELVRVAEWVRGVGQGYELTPEGKTAVADPARERLNRENPVRECGGAAPRAARPDRSRNRQRSRGGWRAA